MGDQLLDGHGNADSDCLDFREHLNDLYASC